jgi:integrase
MRRRDVASSGNSVWSIPATVTKNHRAHQVPLSPEAVAIIQAQPVTSSDLLEKGAELVFTTNGTTPFSGWSKLKTQIDRHIAEDGGEPIAPWTMHDLRRSLVTGLNEHGLAQPHVIELIVNHVSGLRGGIAGIYDKSARLEERRRALEAWAKLVVGAAEKNNVVPLQARG